MAIMHHGGLLTGRMGDKEAPAGCSGDAEAEEEHQSIKGRPMGHRHNINGR